MYISRDMNGELWVFSTLPDFHEDNGYFDNDIADGKEIAMTAFWREIAPGDCRQLVLGDYLFEGGVSVAGQK